MHGKEICLYADKDYMGNLYYPPPPPPAIHFFSVILALQDEVHFSKDALHRYL